MVNPLLLEATSVWLDQSKYAAAELLYQESLTNNHNIEAAPTHTTKTATCGGGSLITEIVQARESIHRALNTPGTGSSGRNDSDRITVLEKENSTLKQVTQDLQKMIEKLEKRVAALEIQGKTTASVTTAPPAKVPAPPKDDESDDDDDDIDLFGSSDSEEDEAAEKIKEERIKAYNEKKATKVAVIAKSAIVIDVKPWDDETDMKLVEKCVREIVMDGLVWGGGKLAPIGYGIHKLQISCVIEDEKVSVEDLQEKIEAIDDYVQSTDIAAFNKV